LRAAIPAMVEIRTTCEDDLPNVSANAGQIEQLLMNLGTNAAHAIGECSGTIQVILAKTEVDAAAAQATSDFNIGQYVRISVLDTGCGMDAAVLERIFDPFFTTKQRGQGTGLGLAIVHGIVRSHGGAIRVQSQPNVGTRFDIYLPATAAAAASERSAAASDTIGAQQSILYVDDEESLVLLMKRMLGRLNYRVTGFSDPREAVDSFREAPHAFDAFITDLAMPGMSGFDVVREVSSIRRDIPIVMISGYLHPHDVENAQALGVRALLLKPDSASELAKTLHAIFSADRDQHGALGADPA
jgi:CheY-like chemotaxis protein